MQPIDRRAAAQILSAAERTCTAVAPLTETYPDMTLQDAYAIQLLNVDEKLSAGSAVRGHKIGLTSVAMQEMLGVHEPDYGHLLNNMFINDGATINSDRYLHARVEIEIAFVLGRDLTGGGVNAADVLRCTEFVIPAIEVIDSRIADWKITLADTIADNASSAGVVLGGRPTKLEDVDLRLTGGVLERSGRLVETGVGAAVLGNPLVAVAWLANKLYESEITLQEGDVVLSGSCTRAVDIRPGDVFRAEFAKLGVVTVAFD